MLTVRSIATQESTARFRARVIADVRHMTKYYRSIGSVVVVGFILALAACAGPTVMTDAERSSLRRIVVVAAQNPSRIHFATEGPSSSLPLAAGMGAQAATQRKFDSVFTSYVPDVARPLTEAALSTLRASGYSVTLSPSDIKPDAILVLNLRAAGYGPSFDGVALVPQFFLIVSLTRETDQKLLYTESFAYGGGFSGTITKLPHDASLAFRAPEEVLSQPGLVAARLVEGARSLGTRSVEQLRR